jgi:uncharacterized phage protein (TIGR02220 family)
MSDPAFLMYPKDWISGTGEMTLAEKGAYIGLLCYQHQNDGLPNSIDRIARIVGVSISEFTPIWNEIKCKFYEAENGRLYNHKMAQEVDRRKEYGRKKSILGIFGAAIKKMNAAPEIIAAVKKAFDYRDFLELDDNQIRSQIEAKLQAELQAQRKHNTGTGTASGTGTTNSTKEKGGEGEKGLIAQGLIQYLNELAERSYLVTNQLYLRRIIQRLNEGYTEQDLREIIEIKVVEWKGGEMEKFLQPDTLFNREKCNKYRDQVREAKEKGLSVTQIRGEKKTGNANLMAEVQESLRRKFQTQ